jgi:hypothetical protein
MKQQEALQILINAVTLANTKGAFTLSDSKIIAIAVEAFTNPPETNKSEIEKIIEETKNTKKK